MELTTHLVQESRPTRLLEYSPYAVGIQAKDGILTLSDMAFQPDIRPTPQRWMNTFRLQPGTFYSVG